MSVCRGAKRHNTPAGKQGAVSQYLTRTAAPQWCDVPVSCVGHLFCSIITHSLSWGVNLFLREKSLIKNHAPIFMGALAFASRTMRHFHPRFRASHLC